MKVFIHNLFGISICEQPRRRCMLQTKMQAKSNQAEECSSIWGPTWSFPQDTDVTSPFGPSKHIESSCGRLISQTFRVFSEEPAAMQRPSREISIFTKNELALNVSDLNTASGLDMSVMLYIEMLFEAWKWFSYTSPHQQPVAHHSRVIHS